MDSPLDGGSFSFGRQPKKLVIKNLPENTEVNVADYESKSWPLIQASILRIFSQQPLSCAYQSLYRACENLCLFGLGGKLYARVVGEIEAYLLDVHSKLDLASKSLYSDGFLEAVNNSWQQFISSVRQLQSIFAYLDRFQLPQLGNGTLRRIWKFSVDCFRGTVFASGSEVRCKLTASLIDSIVKERQGAPLSRPLVSSLCSMLVELDEYEPVLEEAFLECSDVFYAQLARDHLADFQIVDYLLFVESRIVEESTRVQEYLCEKTKRPLLVILDRYLLREPVEKLCTEGLLALFQTFDSVSIRRLFRLMERISCLETLNSTFGRLIKEIGGALMGKASVDDAALMRELLELHSRFTSVVAECFSGREEFGNTLKDSFESFINLKETRAAELVAKQFDLILRELVSDDSEHAGSDSSDDMIHRLIGIFRFLHGKEAFEACYKRDLARRLLYGKASSSALERSIVQQLNTECGPSYTSKMEGMLRDMQQLSQHLDQWRGNFQFEFKPMLLSSGFWPDYPQSSIKLPKPIETAMREFERNYGRVFSGRKISWQPAMSFCTITANFPRGSKELLVSTQQAVVLLQFNDADQISFAVLRQRSGIEISDLKKTLLTLSCSKVRVLVKFPNTAGISDSDEFSFNKDFVSKLSRLKVNSMQLRELSEPAESKGEASTAFAAPTYRQYQLDAAIVKLLKVSKTMKFEFLVAELAKKFSPLPKTSDIVNRVNELVEREFIERVANNTLKYLP